MGGKHLGQRGISAADISGDGDMHSVYIFTRVANKSE
jgi:hypothetical protein